MQEQKDVKFVILGRIPSKKNSRITTRSGRTFPSKQYTKWHKDASLQLSLQVYKHFDFRAGTAEIVFWMPDARRTDLTNKAESIMDLLVDVGVIPDDCWKVIGKIVLKCRGIDRTNPRAEILLTEERTAECANA